MKGISVTTTEQPEKTESTETPVAAPETTPAPAAKDSILAKAPTSLHRRYAKYIVEKFGFEVPGAGVPEDFFEAGDEEWERFVKVVQIAVVRYGEFQKSPENAELKALDAQRKEKERAAADAEKKRLAEEKAKAKAETDAANAAKAQANAATADGGDEAKTRKPATAGKAKAANAPEAPF